MTNITFSKQSYPKDRYAWTRIWMIMRLVTIFILFSTLTLSARSFSQKVNLSLKNTSVQNVFEQIRQQTGCSFLWTKETLKDLPKVNVSLHEANLEGALKAVLKELPLTFDINGNVVFIKRSPRATRQIPSPFSSLLPAYTTITGKVVDSITGKPLTGVSVKIKGSAQGTATDTQGNFKLNVSGEVVLEFSYVGYNAKTISTMGKSNIQVALSPNDSWLKELVVVGYGTKTKATVTGSIATVSGATLEEAPAPNLTTSMTGRMTGVIINTRGANPGNEQMQINIRGKSSWQGGSPLVIVDGIADRTDWDRIDPDAIESVSVLKDASAAIYGSRAANGVILITTKRGKSGKPMLTYHGDYGLTRATRVPAMTRSWQYAQYFTEAKRSGYIFTDEEIEKFKEGADPNLYPNYELADYVLNNGAPQTTHSLSISGGNNGVKYFISGRYLYQGAIYKDAVDNFKSYNLRSNLDIQIVDNLKLSLNLSAQRNDKLAAVGSSESSGFFEEMLGTNPTMPIFYKNGYPAAIYDENIVEQIKGAAGTTKDGTTLLNTQATATWDLPFITKGLYLMGTVSYDFTNTRTKQFSKSYDVYSYSNADDDYANLNTNPVNNRSLYDYYYNDHRYSLQARLGYEHTFNALHHITAFLAYEQYTENNEWINGSRSTFLTDQIPYLFMGGADNQKNDGSGYQNAYRNTFSRISYDFQKKYLLDLTLRRDESLKFAPGKRVGWFPGVAAGWVVSEEKFMKSAETPFNQLKVRASWGQMGSDNVADYQYLRTAAIRGSDASMVLGQESVVVPTLYMTGTANPDIHWEVASSYNFAIEGSLWNGLLGFDVEYFYSKRSNILATRNASVPLYTGLVLPAENIGKAQNKGIEVSLTHHNKIGQVDYNIGLNFSQTANKIIYMDEAAGVPDYQKQEGHPIDSWLLYKTDGIFNTQAELDATAAKRTGAQLGDIKYVDVDGDGAITDNDRIRLYESSLPKYIFGMPIDVKYKQFDLSMLWQGQAGAKTYVNPTERNGDINIPLWMYNNRWTPDNQQSATMPRAFYHRSETYNTIASDFWLRDASFVRLKSLQLGYTLPNIKISKGNDQSSIMFYISGLNLLLFDKIKDYDPEIVNDLGVFYPSTKVYNVGVKVTF